MSTDYKDVDAQCPFFWKLKHINIACGELDGAKVTLGFPNGRDRDAWYRDLCCDSYKQCMMYRLLEDAYVEK